MSLRQDFIKLQYGFTLSNALSHIQQKRSSADRYSVTIYKQVINKEKSYNYTELIFENKKPYSKQIFKSVKDGVYQVDLVEKMNNFDVGEDVLTQQNEFFPTNETFDKSQVLQLFDEYFQGNSKIHFSDLVLWNDLNMQHNQVHLKLNQSLLLKSEPMSGVNVPVWNISSLRSVVPFTNHTLDLIHLNILLQGKYTVYIFIPMPYLNILQQKLYLLMKNDCRMKLFHKPGCIINPRLLLEWRIPDQFYVQQPGDLICINRGVLFSAINMSCNLNESIHYLNEKSINNLFSSYCGCNGIFRIHQKLFENMKKDLVKPKNVQEKKSTNHSTLQKPFFCSHKNSKEFAACEYDNEKDLNTNKSKKKRKLSAQYFLKRREKIQCNICEEYKSRRNLRRHIAQKHHLKGTFLSKTMKIHFESNMTALKESFRQEIDMVNNGDNVDNDNEHGEYVARVKQGFYARKSKPFLENVENSNFQTLENCASKVRCMNFQVREPIQKLDRKQVAHLNSVHDLNLQIAKQEINKLTNEKCKMLKFIKKLEETIKQQENQKTEEIKQLQVELGNSENKRIQMKLETMACKILKSFN